MESTIDLVHAAQWAALRAWVTVVPDSVRQRDSAVPGWTIDELLSHLARSVDAIAALRPTGHADVDGAAAEVELTQVIPTDEAAGTDDDPLVSVSDYLGGYADRRHDIDAQTKRSAAASAADRTGEWDAAFTQAQRTLRALGERDQPVVTKSGPMALSDFLQTRLVELVVHSRDLERSLPDYPGPPVLPAAAARVNDSLRAVLVERTGTALPAAAARLTPEVFIDVASGRSPVPHGLPTALKDALPLF